MEQQAGSELQAVPGSLLETYSPEKLHLPPTKSNKNLCMLFGPRFGVLKVTELCAVLFFSNWRGTRKFRFWKGLWVSLGVRGKVFRSYFFLKNRTCFFLFLISPPPPHTHTILPICQPRSGFELCEVVASTSDSGECFNQLAQSQYLQCPPSKLQINPLLMLMFVLFY